MAVDHGTADGAAAALQIKAMGAAGAETEATRLHPEEAVHRCQRIASRCYLPAREPPKCVLHQISRLASCKFVVCTRNVDR